MIAAGDDPPTPLVAELEALLSASHANRDVLRDLLAIVVDRLADIPVTPRE